MDGNLESKLVVGGMRRWAWRRYVTSIMLVLVLDSDRIHCHSKSTLLALDFEVVDSE